MRTAIVSLDAPSLDVPGTGRPARPAATAIVDTLWLSVLGSDRVEHIHVATRPEGADALFFLARDADPDRVLAVCRRAIAGTPWLAGWTAGFEMAAAGW
ncbi:hypothetical protein [Catenulispora rubra]|uniref:hypothetical protein n=1 Tax=Catenulispora rubra TaxID=280293 RepID=UPI00189269E3|nr:hypothetical protein [Catenulispora rubra]